MKKIEHEIWKSLHVPSHCLPVHPWPLSLLCFLRETVPCHVKAMPLPVLLPPACASSVLLSCASRLSPFPPAVDILKPFSPSASRSLPLAPSVSSYSLFPPLIIQILRERRLPLLSPLQSPCVSILDRDVSSVTQAPPTVAGCTVHLSFLFLLASGFVVFDPFPRDLFSEALPPWPLGFWMIVTPKKASRSPSGP